MTRKTFRLMFVAGLLLLSNLFVGCGAFGGGKTDKVTSLQLQNENLRGQLEGAERERNRALDDLREVEEELAQANDELKSGARSGPAGDPGSPEVITVSGSVLFVTGKADLTSAGKRKLASVASDIKSRYPGQYLSVEGHTDSSPMIKTKATWGTNMWLSANRANAVATYLISQGIAENLVSVVGHGSSRPSGGGPDQDRRVEIIVLAR